MQRSMLDIRNGVNTSAMRAGFSPARFRVAALLLALIPLIAPHLSAQEIDERPLLFLGNQNLKPVVYERDGSPAGLAVELVRALEPKIGRHITIVCMDWTKAQTMVASGDADALIQINPTAERMRLYDFSEPFIRSEFTIFTQGDRTDIVGAGSLRGLRVGVEQNGFPDRVLRSDAMISLVTIPDFLVGFRMLAGGELDAVVVDHIVGVSTLAENRIKGIRVAPEPVAFSDSAIAVRKGNTELLSAINRGLRDIKRDGTYENILKVWERKDVLYLTREQIRLRILAIAAGALLLLAIVAMLWTMTLNRELGKRKLTELRLKDQYSTLRGIVESVDAIMFSVDLLYCYTSYNKAHADTMKAIYGTEVAIGRSLLDCVTVAEDCDIAKHNLDRSLAGEHFEQETYSGDSGRDRRYYRAAHSPIVSPEGMVVGVAVLSQDLTERRRAEEDLIRLNRELKAIVTCNQAVLMAHDEHCLLSELCRIICDEAGYMMAWVGYAEHDAEKSVRPIAWAGFEDGYLSLANISWADTERGRGPSGTAIRTGESSWIQDFESDPHAAPWRDNARLHGYRSSIAAPLKDEYGRAFGVICIYSADAGAFNPDEVRLLEGLADNLAVGIAVLRSRAERLAELGFLKSMDRINFIIQGNDGIESMLRDILEVLLPLFASDRVVLLYPCDPGSDFLTTQVDLRMQSSVAENGATADIPMDPELARMIRGILASGGPELFGPGSGRELPKALLASFGAKSLMVMALCPRVGKPWLFGIMRHDAIRGWSVEEQRRYLEVGMRLSDALTGVLANRELLESEEKLRRVNAELEHRVQDRTGELVKMNAELERLNRIFIGREKKMIELKLRLRQLEARDAGDRPNA